MADRAFKLNVPASVDSGTTLDISRFRELSWQVQGTGWVATMQLEGRLRGGTFVALGASVTAADIGAVRSVPENIEEVRVTVTAYTSGAPAARIHGDLV